MALVDEKGNPLSGKDIRVLEKLLRGSLEEHRRLVSETLKDKKWRWKDASNLFAPIEAVYQNAIKELPARLARAQSDSQRIPFPDFISRLFSDISRQCRSDIDKNSTDYSLFKLMLPYLPTAMKSAI